MTVSRTRLPASERRAAVLECACRVFSRASYHGATTAEIAREAGVTEPVLYRHFESKRELYLTCLAETWNELRTRWEEAIAAEKDPAEWVGAMARAYFSMSESRQIGNLWVQTLAEASEDAILRREMSKHIRQVHAYARDVIRRSQEAGGVLPDRDATAEAWLFISMGLLKTFDQRLGGVLEGDFEAIVASRRRWMLGR
ncbi:MAG: TetR/AcrR family transcriptional regulator [Actinobacteria bacterium]|nr:TetR/AcrR family transcriptional regulator [Actinomycetota bacterium]